MSLRLAVFASAFVAFPALASQALHLSCTLQPGGTPRYSVTKVKVTVEGEDQIEIRYIEKDGFHKTFKPRVYDRAGQAPDGDMYAGFGIYKPSRQYHREDIAVTDFPRVFFDLPKSGAAIVAFGGTQGARYICKPTAP